MKSFHPSDLHFCPVGTALETQHRTLERARAGRTGRRARHRPAGVPRAGGILFGCRRSRGSGGRGCGVLALLGPAGGGEEHATEGQGAQGQPCQLGAGGAGEGQRAGR